MSQIKFVADHMLGKLAKWLRLLGYDVLYPESPKSDKEILEIAQASERILLTRDRQLAGRCKNALLLSANNVGGQISELKEKLDLKMELELDRCSVCNEPIEKVEQGFVRGKVPERVFATFKEFWYCRKCRKIYWYGSHVENMEARLKDVIHS